MRESTDLHSSFTYTAFTVLLADIAVSRHVSMYLTVSLLLKNPQVCISTNTLLTVCNKWKYSGFFFLPFFLSLENDGFAFQDSSVSTFGTSTPANNYREGLNQVAFLRMIWWNYVHYQFIDYIFTPAVSTQYVKTRKTKICNCEWLVSPCHTGNWGIGTDLYFANAYWIWKSE